jgi:hypothetical protein
VHKEYKVAYINVKRVMFRFETKVSWVFTKSCVVCQYIFASCTDFIVGSQCK